MPGPIDPREYNEGERPLTDADLEEDGYASGLDVWEQVEKAYIENYLDGENLLGNCQLWSLREAIRAEYAAELAQPACPATSSGLSESLPCSRPVGHEGWHAGFNPATGQTATWSN